MMHKALHHRDDIDRLYVSRKEGGRGLVSVEDSVDTSLRRLKDYIKKSKCNANNTRINRTAISRKQKCEEKQLYGYIKRKTVAYSYACRIVTTTLFFRKIYLSLYLKGY